MGHTRGQHKDGRVPSNPQWPCVGYGDLCRPRDPWRSWRLIDKSLQRRGFKASSRVHGGLDLIAGERKCDHASVEGIGVESVLLKIIDVSPDRHDEVPTKLSANLRA